MESTQLDEDHSVAATEILLPFAIWPEEHNPVTEAGCHVLGQALSSSAAPSLFGNTSAHISSSQQLPALEASLVSSPEDDSQLFNHSDYAASSSLLQPSSQYLDTAASLLLPMSSLIGSAAFRPPDTALSDASSSSIIQSPQFMSKVVDHSGNVDRRTRLSPVLPEESASSQPSLRPSAPSSRLSSPRLGPATSNSAHMMLSDNTIIPGASTVGFESVYIPRHLRPQRRLASLAGATAYRTQPDAFQVSIELVAHSGNMTIRDVMDVVGNPSLLPRWNDAIPDLLITQSSSEGSHWHSGTRPSWKRRPQNGDETSTEAGATDEEDVLIDRRAEHEGEWVEATTTQLIPPDGSSCLVHASRSLMTTLGFPSYGRVVMFVERQRGQVSLTVGPFPGNVEVSHRIRLEQLSPSRMRIVDTVKLRQEGDDDGASPSGHPHHYYGGHIFGYVLEQCFLPSINDYMDHVLSSMARLRFLVENKGEMGYSTYVPPILERQE